MPGTASLAPVSEDGQDHSGPLPADVPCHSLAGDEERPQKAIYWTQEFVEREVLEQGPLVVHDAHRVEGDVDVAGQRSDSVGVLLDRSFIESVNLAVSTVPPAAAMSAATVSSLACVRPAMKTRAPSRANTRATALPTAPPPP
jgi:hypothetical protein